MMTFSPEKQDPDPPLKRWSDLWLKNKKSLDQVVFAMKLQSLPKPPLTNLKPEPDKTLVFDRPKLVADRTSLLSDELLLQILSKMPKSQRNSNFLVSKRWLNLQGRLVRSLKLLDWKFLVSGRLFVRFPNLIHHVNLVNGCVVSPRNSVDSGLKSLASGYPNLRKLMVVSASELGLLSVAEECPTLQELELHRCSDQVLRGIAACQNLQILKLFGNVDGGCEGSYDGIKAIGQCCQMLEELTLTNHRMEGGWLSALSYCENLKTLKFQSCKRIDSDPGLDEHLGSCPALERLHLERCQLRNKRSVRSLFLMCETVREIVFQNCWGLDNDLSSIAGTCRRVKFLSLEGCSLLTTQGLESMLLSWKELQRLQVVACNNIKNGEVTPTLSLLFSSLKELMWRPDTKSQLLSNLAGTGMGKKGFSAIESLAKVKLHWLSWNSHTDDLQCRKYDDERERRKMKKEKGVVIADHERRSEAEEGREEEREETPTDFSAAAVTFCSRYASSQYDFVKVKVWLGDNADHYYVLSRFLLSRMLTVTKIPNHVAIKIALELKKLLIDNSLLDVSQSDLEANLFKLMERRGYGKEYINRYNMMTRFHHQRVPLVILVCGTACVGKSTIATQLAQRLNLPNVLQTEMVYELLRTATDAPLAYSPVWAQEFSSSEELITEFCRECRIVRKGLAGDLKKAMKDGKPIIIEGIHLDPSIYLMDDENKLPSHVPTNVEEPNSLKSDDKNALQMESNSSNFCGKHSENRNCSPQNAMSEVGLSADLLNKVSDCLESINIAASVSDDKGLLLI
ncbi:P-loop containing nucleoside triphosphate hydrolases superfamily protein [Actinidia rufa]|uniref:P-loop containing nucleoside triphosphate hydrolases superfamily protein n=1 Tax=Actinidia rufa TaxID=165716 RepID=A0A7J0ED69_9ERIC|nr:P-loop containing nucleoside triphosphate hydrolases superfamily protein [Actinidia rufa]